MKAIGVVLTFWLLSLLLSGCDNQPDKSAQKANAQSTLAPVPTSAPAAPTKVTASQSVAQLFIGLTSDARNRPNVNALDTLAAAYSWPKVPDNMKAMLNAQAGYVGKVGGQTVLLGSDGTNDILSVAMRDQFVPEEILNELRQVYTLRPKGVDTEDGQRMDAFTMIDGDHAVGLVTLTYGVVKAIQGTGTLGYISIDRARREMPDLRE